MQLRRHGPIIFTVIDIVHAFVVGFLLMMVMLIMMVTVSRNRFEVLLPRNGGLHEARQAVGVSQVVRLVVPMAMM